MAEQPINYRKASEKDYHTGTPSAMGYIYAPTTDQLKVGTMQRLADAAERVANALENGRIQLPTAVVQIQPKHADEFIQLVTEVVANRPGRVYIAAWHLEDEHVLLVTVAYERGESLFFIGRYWEQIRAEERFAQAQYQDGKNHLLLRKTKGSRRIDAHFLASSPQMADQLYEGAAGSLEVIINQANEAERSQGHD